MEQLKSVLSERLLMCVYASIGEVANSLPHHHFSMLGTPLDEQLRTAVLEEGRKVFDVHEHTHSTVVD